MAEIKVFRLNDYEFWAGESLASIRPVYKRRTGIDPDDVDSGFDHPCEVGPEGMSRIIIHDDGPEVQKQTFREYLDDLIATGQRFPCFFAGVE